MANERETTDEEAVRAILTTALLGLAFGIEPDRPSLLAATERVNAMVESACEQA